MPKRTKMSPEEYKKRRSASWKKWRAKNRDTLLAKARARYALNSDREKGRHKEWAEKNLCHLRTYERTRYKSDPEPKKQHARNWRRCNPDYNPAACRRYVKNNPEIIRESWRAARHRRRNAAGSFSPSDVRDIRRMQNGRCAYCEKKVRGPNEHLDHIVALAKGGTNNRSNLQILCELCNKRKSSRDPMEFARTEYGFLL